MGEPRLLSPTAPEKKILKYNYIYTSNVVLLSHWNSLPEGDQQVKVKRIGGNKSLAPQ